MLNLKVKFGLQLIWSPSTSSGMCVCVSLTVLNSSHPSIFTSLFPSVSSIPRFFFNEFHEAVHIDPLNPTNEGGDPPAASLVSSTPGVNRSNFTLINHINSNWLLITCSVASGSSTSFFTFSRSPLN